MIVKTPYTVNLDLINNALASVHTFDFKTSLNEPVGDFFYSPWAIKQEFIGTPWEQILHSLPPIIGEARVIRLKGNESYFSHADTDDRYHLNLTGSKSFLIDLDSQTLYPTICDGTWYEMDAGVRHTAANFGNRDRYQLVVRKLLPRNKLYDRVSVKIVSTITDLDEARYQFDDLISPWMNRTIKQGKIDKFNYVDGVIMFDCERLEFEVLKNMLPTEFKLV